LTSTGHRVESSLADFGGDETVTDAICDHLNAHRIASPTSRWGTNRKKPAKQVATLSG